MWGWKLKFLRHLLVIYGRSIIITHTMSDFNSCFRVDLVFVKCEFFFLNPRPSLYVLLFRRVKFLLGGRLPNAHSPRFDGDTENASNAVDERPTRTNTDIEAKAHLGALFFLFFFACACNLEYVILFMPTRPIQLRSLVRRYASYVVDERPTRVHTDTNSTAPPRYAS